MFSLYHPPVPPKWKGFFPSWTPHRPSWWSWGLSPNAFGCHVCLKTKKNKNIQGINQTFVLKFPTQMWCSPARPHHKSLDFEGINHVQNSGHIPRPMIGISKYQLFVTGSWQTASNPECNFQSQKFDWSNPWSSAPRSTKLWRGFGGTHHNLYVFGKDFFHPITKIVDKDNRQPMKPVGTVLSHVCCEDTLAEKALGGVQSRRRENADSYASWRIATNTWHHVAQGDLVHSIELLSARDVPNPHRQKTVYH